MSLQEKIRKVKDILKDKKIAISFSGGADSSLMAYLAKDVCKSLLAITVDNNILPQNFIKDTENFCKKYNIKQEIIFEDFYKHDDIIANNHNRCFLCRREMYKHIIATARENNITTIVDGTNISDLVVDRPGILINYENNILSPFVEAKLTSKEIHEYLNENNIPYSRSTTCLATRTPFGKTFRKDSYNLISEAEDIVYSNSSCNIVKVRENNKIATIEVDNIDGINFKLINSQLKELGYKKVTLNLEEIDDDEEIVINYENGQFTYELPYKIDLSKTKINNNNIKIEENGLVKGNNYNSYKKAEEEFMEILPKIRRKV